MESLNWNNYQPDDFQLFCNALLSFEIGKQFHPFTAPGKDQGIDGWFKGLYQGSQGNWRFQYKFHKTAPRQGYNSLKADLKKEIENIREEDHFILLTNIELLPKDYNELHTLFVQTYTGNKKINFDVWDGAKLFTLSLQYPLLWLWLEEGFATAQLVNYKDAFAGLLSAPIEEGFTFANRFVSRDDKMDEIFAFMRSENKVALVTGEAGIGKTRLVIEFCKRLDQADDDIYCLVLMNKTIDFDKLTKALSGGKKFLVFVDDAHEYAPQAIADLNAIANNPNLSVKLLLTAREIQSYNSIQLIKEYEQVKIRRIKIDELSREVTFQLLSEELATHYLRSFIEQLVEITYGKPILIVSVLRAAANNIPIEEIKKEDFLNSYVKKYFTAFTDQVAADTGITKLKAWKLLQVICLIEPFNYADSAIVEKIASALGVETDEVNHALQILKNGTFVSGRYESTVKPDYYSDIILKTTGEAIIEQTLKAFPELTQNLIANLASVDEIRSQDRSILDQALNNYVQTIKNPGTSIDVSNVLQTIATIAFVKPVIVKTVTELYLSAIQDPQSLIYIDYHQYKHYNRQSHDSITSRIVGLLTELLYHKEYFDFVYHTIFQMNALLNEPKWFSSVFHFSKRDYVENYVLPRQSFFLVTLQKEYTSLPKEQLLFAMECLKSFLVHDFTAATIAGNSRNSISVMTYYIPNQSKVKKIRKEVIELLIDICKTSEDVDVKNEAINELLDIPRGIFATSRNPTPYKGDDEIKLVLNFLNTEAGSIPQVSQKEVLDKLFWYKRWGINPELMPVLDSIKESLKPRNLTEELIQLFSNAETRIENYRKAEEEVKTKSRDIITSREVEAITESLAAIFRAYGNKLHYFFQFISVLTDEYPDQSKSIYDLLWKNSPDFIYHWGATFLQAIYLKHKDAGFYWSRVEQLGALQTAEADNVILWGYTFYHAGAMTLSDPDFAEIERIANKKDPKNHFSLARALIVFVVQRPERGLELSLEFLERCHYQEADSFFLFLSDDHPSAYNEIRTLALKGTIWFELSYNMEKCLNAVLLKEGIDPIFDYLLLRVERKRFIYLTKKSLIAYDLVPDGKHTHLFDGTPESARFELLIKTLDWFCQTSFDELEVYYIKDLFDYLNQVEYITEATKAGYATLIKKYPEDKIALGRILEALSVYHSKNELLLELITTVYNLAYVIAPDDGEYIRSLDYKAYGAITEVGVKSGTAGEPFDVDLNLKQLLETYIQQIPESSPSRRIITNAIRSVEQTIQSSFDRGNETW